MKKPILSIIIPTFNSENYIARTIESLFNMIGKCTNCVEVIFIDDGSSDGTLSVLKKLQKRHHFLRIISNSHQGVSIARNSGIEIASGKYITFLDSDDTFETKFIENFKKLVSAYDEPDLIFVDVEKIDRPKLIDNLDDDERLVAMQSTLNLGTIKTKQGIASKFFKRSFILDEKLFYDSRIVISEDALFNINCISRANSILFAPNLFYHVEESHTLKYYSSKNLSGQLAFLNELKKILLKYGNNKKALEILNQSKLKAVNLIVDRYYGPLYINGTYNLRESASLLKKVIKSNDLSVAFKTNEFDEILSLRYRIFRRLLKYQQYSLCFLCDKLFDRIKGYNRFK